MVTHKWSAQRSALFPSDLWLIQGKMSHKYKGLRKCSANCCWEVFNWGWNPFGVWHFFLWALWWDCSFVCCCGSTGKIKTRTTVYLFGKILPCTWWHERMHTFSASLLLHKWKSLCGALWLSVWHDYRNSAGTQCEIQLLLYRQTWQKSSSGLFLSSQTQMQEWLHHYQCVYQIQAQFWPQDWPDASYLMWTSPEYFAELLRRRKSFLLRIFLN